MSKFRKAVGVAIAGVYAWWGAVIVSASGPITAGEWYALGGVAVAVAAVYGLTNAPVDPPAAPKVKQQDAPPPAAEPVPYPS